MNKTRDLTKAFIDTSVEFFDGVNGKVTKISSVTRDNIEILSLNANSKIEALCFYVEFKERNKFGKVVDYSNAYDIYRKMRSDWWEYLKNKGHALWEDSTKIICHYVPYLANNSKEGIEYHKQETPSYGQYLKQYDEVKGASKYYDRIHKDYDVNWFLKDGHGITIGPDVGLLIALDALRKSYKSIETMVDVGAGTGELSNFVIRKQLSKNIVLNEFSPYLQKHLEGLFQKIENVNINMQFGNALEMTLPDKIDIISIGIYYGYQPPFIEVFGDHLVQALGDDGMMIIQSGMLEGVFNISSVIGNDKNLNFWIWYNNKNTLLNYFKHVETISIAEEAITFATNSKQKLREVLYILKNHDMVKEMPKMSEINFTKN